VGLFNFDNNYISQLAKNFIFSQNNDDAMQNRDKLVEKGERGTEALLKVLYREKDNPNIDWILALTTLDIIGGESEELVEKFVLKGISIYQQSNSKSINIYDFFYLYDQYGSELYNFAERELVRIGNSNFDNLINAMTYQFEEGLKAEEGYYPMDVLELLKEFKNDKSIGFLINLLFDSNIEIRLVVARVLGEINDIRAVGALAQTLCNDTSGRVKYNASVALAKIGFPAVNTLLQVIHVQNPKVRRLAADALGEIGDRKALQSLTRLLSDIDPEVQKEANKAIEKICKTHNLNPQQFIQQSQSQNKGITEIKNNHSIRVNDPAQRLKKVKELFDMGAITKEEFERKKKQLLDRI